MDNPKTFACYSKNKKILKRSSSGGVFYTLASYYINKLDGVVYGATIVDGDVYHTKATTIDELLPLLGSKYVRSNLKNTFKECQDDLINGKYVIYSGTPCQINALHFYLNRNNVNKEKLLSVDIICHGTPKRKYWDKYLELNFTKEDIKTINFRYKKHGWEKYYIKIGNYEVPYMQDPFMKLFLNNMILEESCFNCQCKGENRKADITLGDFWGIDNVDYRFKNKKGTSLVIVRNKFDLLFDIISQRCTTNEVPYLDSFYIHNTSFFKSTSKYHQKDILDEDLLINLKKNKTFNKEIIKTHIFLLRNRINKHKPTIVINNKKRSLNNKIGIITDLGYWNYGNRLQNYALHIILRKYNKKTYNIHCQTADYNFLYQIEHIIRFHKIYNPIDKEKYIESVKNVSKLYENKPFIFAKTRKKQKRLCDFETIIVGSDQIWNAGYHPYKNDLEYSLGNFGIFNRPFKLLSYAPSICLNELDPDIQFAFKHSLNQFDSISVREESASKLLKDIDIESTVVLDPVLLLGVEDWEKAIKNYSSMPLPNTKYTFIYSFGNITFAKGVDGIVINPLSKKDHYSNMNQFDFVNFIKNAHTIVTDSFHCLVFSILFQKKVYIVERKELNMDNRIKDLFNTIDITLKYNTEINFKMVNMDKLKEAINLSMDYLVNNIKVQ